MSEKVKEICKKYNNDRGLMMNIVNDVQSEFGNVSSEAMGIITKETGTHRVEVEGVVSFYSFLSTKQKGKIVVRLCNDVVDEMQGVKEVADAISEEFGIKFGETTSDGKVTLEYTPCIGMCDQAPAALINETVFTSLNPEKAKTLAKNIKSGKKINELDDALGDGNNADTLVKSMVNNNIRKKGEVIFSQYKSGDGLKKALEKTPLEVISEIKDSGLRGRGGAGFPTGLKWEFTSKAQGENKTVICNADEGEPGTFKDRVLLTEKLELLFEGMAIAGYAIGSDKGIIYLRGEYAYLRAYIENKLNLQREANLLGNNILGKDGFNFDIRVQMGAGAYICGEETALISSCEGLRGDPKNRPPFPAQKGYLQTPTTVNNVETLCAVARIAEKGALWFKKIGNSKSSGTKLLSISGDCKSPGVYEFPFGVKISELLKETGAENTQAVLIAGPSGQIIGETDFNRTICYGDLATGGAIVIFNKKRDLLEIVSKYMEFFIEESCGYCTPCRVGNVLLKKALDSIIQGKGKLSDLEYLKKLGETVKFASRCGLGQTSPNPILTTLKNFKSLYENLIIKKDDDGRQMTFDIKEALRTSEEITGRNSVIY